LADLTRASWLPRAYWWLVTASVPVAYLLCWDTSAHARSADEALGLAFILAPLLLAGAALGLGIIVRAALSKTIERKERVALVLLGLSAVPWIVLLAGLGSLVGDWHRDPTPGDHALALALVGGWVAGALAVRRRLHRGLPEVGTRLLGRGAIWLLYLQPPVSMVMAIGQASTALVVALALAPVVVYRATFMPGARAERIALVAAVLLSVGGFLLLFTVDQLAPRPDDTRPTSTPLALAVVAGWTLVAGLAARRLRAPD
jgi:hypothetical protein